MGQFSSLEQIDTVQRFQPAPRQLSAGFFLGHAPAADIAQRPSVFRWRAVVVRVETRVVTRLAFPLQSLLPLSLTLSHCS